MSQICLMCGSKTNKFYASRKILNSYFGKMSVCQNCLSELYNEKYQRYQDNYIVMDELCKELNIPFEDTIFEIAKGKLENNGTLIYAGYLTYYNSATGKKYGNYYTDSSKFKIKDKFEETDDEEIDSDLIFFWGDGFEFSDYEYLEWDLQEWSETHPSDSRSEKTLLKEICIKELELRNARKKGEPTKDLLKEFQELIKTAGVDPAKINAIKKDKISDCFGIWVEEIEKLKPAEWHNKQEKYKDMDGFGKYLEKYVTRPIKNFITGSRDFNVDYEMMSNIEENNNGE